MPQADNVQRSVQPRFAHAHIDHLDMKRRVLVGNVGVEGSPWAAAVFRIDMPRALGFAAGSKILAI